MTLARRPLVVLLAAALAAVCLVAGMTPAQAGTRAPGATEATGFGTLTRGEASALPAGPKPEAVQLHPERVPGPDSPTVGADPDEPSGAATPVAGDRAWTTLMSENFDGAWPPAGSLWTTFDNNGATYGEFYWDDDDYMSHNGTKSAWPANGGADGLDPALWYYPYNMDSWMTYGPFDLSGATAAKLEFWYWNESEPSYDRFWWMASHDDSTYSGSWVSGDSGGWVFETLDLMAYLGDSSVWIGFSFTSDYINVDDGPFVDAVVLSIQGGTTTPPGAFSKTAPPNGATGMSLSPTLSWGVSTGAASYEYCYDTSNDSACTGGWTSTGTTTSANLAGLTPSTTYYWQVRAKNGAGTTYANGASTSYRNFTTTDAPATREWTYMVYLDGDNNLEPEAVNDFLEMSSVGSTSQVAVVVQMDRIAGYSGLYGNWTDTRRFYVTNGMTPAAANGTTIGEANMGAEATLVEFVQWAMANYPANHYALVLWDHGSGWRSRALDDPMTEGIAYDDTSSGDGIDMLELRSALNTLTSAGANPFDLLGLDACLMALIEVDDQIRPYAEVRVTSQETEPGDGWPHDSLLTALTGNPAMTANALGTVVVDEYYASYGNSNTQSAADLGADYAALNTAVNNFAAALLANGAANAAGIRAARNAVQDFEFDYYIDLYDFASRVSTNVANAAIDNAAAAVMAAVGPATVHEHHGGTWPGAHGISIYFPKTLGEYDTRYDGSSGFLRFTVDTQWDEWVRAYYGYGTAPLTNDDFNTATAIGAVPYTNTQEIAGATTAGDDPGFPCSSDNLRYLTVWYRYTPATADPLTIDTVGSSYDTVLAVWTGSRGSLTNVACNDDGVGLQSRVQFTPSPGTTYYIEAASYGPDPTTPQLTLNVAGTTPAGLAKTSPANGATGVSLSPTLSWQAASGALWYGYCYDTTDNDACDPISWQDNGTATSADLSGLAPNTTYYWQVFASTSSLPVYGDAGEWWSFTTGAPVPQEMTFHSLSFYDGWVLEQDETSGKGGTFDAGATTGRLGDDALDRQYRSILDFDTSLLPDNAVITGVTVRLKKQAIVGTNPFTATFGYLIVDIKTGFYHELQPLEKFDFQAAGSRGNVGRFIKTPTDGWYRAPLRARNYTLINLTGTTQLRLRFEIDDNDNGVADYLSFYTGNAAEADRPELIITYYVP